MLIGDVEILPVHDGLVRVPPTAAYTGTTDDQWEPHRDLLAEDGMLEMELGGFLVRGAGRTVLVDAGMGPITRGIFSGGAMLDSLSSYGVSTDDVTDVLFTHLHFDHVGWATQQGAPVFQRATYRCHTRDWEHFVTDPDGGAARKLGPLEDRLEPWSAGGPVVPGIDALDAPGHTPGSTVLVVSSGTERAVLLGDVVHCPVELLDDEWEGIGDVDPDLAQRTRVAMLREWEGTDVPLSAAHFPGMQFGRLLTGEGKRRWVV